MSSDAPGRTGRVALAAAVALIVLAGCNDMTLLRAKSDYFPLISGSRWTYDVAGNAAVDSVAGDSAIDDRACIVVLRDYSPEYWTKAATEARKLTRLTVIREGQEYTIEERYGLVYELPFVLGATWSESFCDTVVLMGTDTVKLNDSLAGRVAAIDSVATPAGTFIQCYRVDTYRDIKTVEPSDTTDSLLVYSEWLAPGVGLVKRVTGTETRVLTAYEPGS
ncbi:MAG TPA: hypothetical protein VMH22_13370 [bacterium]|nr:hypothetical protein [bacterium]